MSNSSHFCPSPFKMDVEVLYSVAQFPNGGTAAILRSWFKAEEKIVLWPHSKIKVAKALKDRMQPDDKWISYEDVRLLTTCGE